MDGRNSDNTKIHQELGWAPPTALRDGMEVTAEWMEQQIKRHREEETTSRFAVAHGALKRRTLNVPRFPHQS